MLVPQPPIELNDVSTKRFFGLLNLYLKNLAVDQITSLGVADLPVSNPPTQAEVVAIRDACILNRNTLVAIIRRIDKTES